ncbi:piggyBac transposable element-derived protein 4-like protein [Lates japonicus]|uniref:PiggyBac transposable element-derived protein 4-like protein n=1 Tax=Lates japonicus TaxID=270547 RepID=A0AAD3N1R8_LATJO|nr:piggyBac transposable element-derived protein 4-like protein [Lates japonicus]
MKVTEENVSETEDDVEEDPDYEASSSDENETVSVDPPVVSQPPANILRSKNGKLLWPVSPPEQQGDESRRLTTYFSSGEPLLRHDVLGFEIQSDGQVFERMGKIRGPGRDSGRDRWRANHFEEESPQRRYTLTKGHYISQKPGSHWTRWESNSRRCGSCGPSLRLESLEEVIVGGRMKELLLLLGRGDSGRVRLRLEEQPQ